MQLSKKIRREMRGDPSSFTVEIIPNLKLNRWKTQKIEKISLDAISLSEEDRSALREIQADFSLCRIVNMKTGGTLFVPFKELEVDNDLSKGEIRLNYRQRVLLEIEIYSEKATESKESKKSEDEFELRIFPCRMFDEKRLWHTVLRRWMRDHIKSFTDWLVGSAKITLRCVRPYELDDASQIVRLSESCMVRLGIEESDKVILSCGSTQETVRVLKIDSADMMRKQNVELKEADLDLVVGVPAPIRRRLKIQNIGYIVYLERSSAFLFKKFFPQQLLTLGMLLLTLVTMIGTLTENRMVISVVVAAFFVALPFIILVLFNEQRIKVDKRLKRNR
jgi:hypothetical protein